MMDFKAHLDEMVAELSTAPREALAFILATDRLARAYFAPRHIRSPAADVILAKKKLREDIAGATEMIQEKRHEQGK
jgi:hypothetical protein